MIEVEMVDERGSALGAIEKLTAHQAPGLLHRAFSVFVTDRLGRLLMQRRAADKYHFGGVWANTCCSHPRPGYLLVEEARLRLEHEMGLDLPVLELGAFIYRAEDPVSGLVEWEYDHVFVARSDDDPSPDPDEVGDWAWVSPHEVETMAPVAPWVPLAVDAFPRLLG